jgi:hypothetical protein
MSEQDNRPGVDYGSLNTACQYPELRTSQHMKRYVASQHQGGVFYAVRKFESAPLGDSHWVEGKVIIMKGSPKRGAV